MMHVVWIVWLQSAVAGGCGVPPATAARRNTDTAYPPSYPTPSTAGQLPLFSLSADNAMVQLVSKGAPRLTESQLDAKKASTYQQQQQQQQHGRQ
jgi:hypothetical protein